MRSTRDATNGKFVDSVNKRFTHSHIRKLIAVSRNPHTPRKPANSLVTSNVTQYCTAWFFAIPYWRFNKKIYKGHSPEPPKLVVKCKETLSRDVTWLRSDAFKKICCWAGLFKIQRKFSEATLSPQSPSPPRSLVRDGQTSPHRPRLVVSRSTCPPISPHPPCKHLCTRSCSNKHTHTFALPFG
jgi:hypothetical protein